MRAVHGTHFLWFIWKRSWEEEKEGDCHIHLLSSPNFSTCSFSFFCIFGVSLLLAESSLYTYSNTPFLSYFWKLEREGKGKVWKERERKGKEESGGEEIVCQEGKGKREGKRRERGKKGGKEREGKGRRGKGRREEGRREKGRREKGRRGKKKGGDEKGI